MEFTILSEPAKVSDIYGFYLTQTSLLTALVRACGHCISLLIGASYLGCSCAVDDAVFANEIEVLFR
jgi:hypothetical protein